MERLQRIPVVGNSGSGKSTAADRVAKRLGVERLELDSVRHQAPRAQLYWRRRNTRRANRASQRGELAEAEADEQELESSSGS